MAPVVAGTALAYANTGSIHYLPFLAALLTAVLIQIATNLHNDAADYERGADTAERLGPQRATAQGWLTAASVHRVAKGCFAVSFLLGIYLVAIGGWPILLLGLLSLAAGTAYSGGPWPISHSPWSELFVFLFFGLAAVMGSYFLQLLALSRDALVIGSALGFLAAAVLVVNNHRDRDSDAQSGRRTTAVLFGAGFSRLEYSLLLVIPFTMILMLDSYNARVLWLPYLALPWAIYLLYRMYRIPGGVLLNSLLAQTAQLQLFFALALSTGLQISGSMPLTDF